MNGIINVYKEKGYTSHDAVARLRGIIGQRHVGHTGTLDPDAEGVLPLCIGTATKVCDILTDKSKVYETVILLGAATDTEDVSGQIISKADPALLESLTAERITEAVLSFKGVSEQIPPMFSAIRKDGQRLYDMARHGVEIDRTPRTIEILSVETVSDVKRGVLGKYDLEPYADSALAKYCSGDEFEEQGHWQREYRCIGEDNAELPVIRVAVRLLCSKGTYVRSFCRDVGEKLGCGGCMERLLRTRVGEFTIDESFKLKELEGFMREGTFESRLKAPDACFTEYERLDMKAKYDDLLYNGNVLYFRHFTQYITEPPTPVRVYSSKGEFLAVYEFVPARNRYTPMKMFREDPGADN